MTREEAIERMKTMRWEHATNPCPDRTAFDMAISALSENKGEFDGMNNGEVMNLVLRKTFPRTIFIRGIDEYNKTKSIVYSEEWENAPYQKGGE